MRVLSSILSWEAPVWREITLSEMKLRSETCTLNWTKELIQQTLAQQRHMNKMFHTDLIYLFKKKTQRNPMNHFHPFSSGLLSLDNFPSFPPLNLSKVHRNSIPPFCQIPRKTINEKSTPQTYSKDESQTLAEAQVIANSTLTVLSRTLAEVRNHRWMTGRWSWHTVTVRVGTTVGLWNLHPP